MRTTHQVRHPVSRRRRTLVLVAITIVGLAGGVAAGIIHLRPTARAERSLAAARSFRAGGRLKEAEEAAANACRLNPALGEAALLAAECAAARRDYAGAVEYAAQVSSGEPRVRLRAALLAARLNHQRLHRLAEAERAYRVALDISPDDVTANTGLATLLGLCGRRTEAIPHVLRVIRRGHATDLLVLMARESGAVDDPTLLEEARRAAPDDPNPLLGLAWRAASADRPEEAIPLLRKAIRLRPDFTPPYVNLGRQLLAGGRYDELESWAENLPATADGFADSWTLRGRLAEHRGEARAAIRCYWEAARRAPESKIPNLRLARLLADAPAAEAAARFADRAVALQAIDEALDRVLFSGGYGHAFSGGYGHVQQLLDLSNRLEAVGRLWEAYGWSLMAAEADSSRDEPRRRVEDLRARVADLPLKLTADAANVALQIDFSSCPLPNFSEPAASPPERDAAPAGRLSFRDDAASVGLAFRYVNGTEGAPTRRMFEFTGGGIGVLDFDSDGWPDVFFTQGRSWPPAGAADNYGDRLFRNHSGLRFDDATAAAGVREADFGQGTAVGDFDADGFADLYVANIGRNRLWRNNGDGTLADATEAAGLAGDDWTTSCVLADLDGDGLCDIYDVNYVMGADVFDRVCSLPDGSPAMCMPYDFEGQPDRLWLNAGDGRFDDASSALPRGQHGKGLGAAMWNPSGGDGPALLVANDTTPNHFLVPERTEDGEFYLSDRAVEFGLAFNGEGKATGCMGIAVGDANDDGRQDVFITNFLSEPNTLYVSRAEGTYEDRTREAALHYPSLDVLGFGTQFLDADLDGRLELFVANGHIDDLRAQGKPYEMPPQLFRRAGRGFEEVPAAELGSYFQSRWLGRSVVRLDWNRDGKEDLAVGHLAADSALLTNTTPDAGRSLSLRLIAGGSSRDAVGTEVRARVGDRTIVRQLTAGDGYEASNERIVVIGVGAAERIDEVVIRWPSGAVQRFGGVPVPLRAAVCEGGRLLLLP